MKKFKQILGVFILALSVLVVFNSCSSSDESGEKDSKKDKKEKTSSNCDGVNKVEKFSFNDVDYTFEVKGVSCDKYEELTYRIFLTNYEDWEKSKLEEGNVKIIIALNSPKGGKFEKGVYTFGNSAEKGNKVALSIYTGTSGMQTYNLANIDDAGFVEVSYLDDETICGKVHLIGQNNSELIADFSAEEK